MTGVNGKRLKNISLSVITFGAIVSSAVLWTRGFIQSPLVEPHLRLEEQFIRDYVQANNPDLQQEKILAESYWLRYSDVRGNSYWGVNGPLGIWGARDHFMQHGKREGRIFAPVVHPEDPEVEQKLADDYWRRYPEIRDSPIWGEKSAMGILGPRDHFYHLGRYEGKTWGFSEQKIR